MRSLYRFLVATGIACSTAAGCSSSSPSPGFDGSMSPPVDASTPIEDSPSCVAIPGLADADLSPYAHQYADAAGGACLVCLVDRCTSAVHACQADCLCGDYLTCVAYEADAGVAAFYICAGDAGTTAAPNVPLVNLYTCEYRTCNTECFPATDGGGSDATSTGSNDATSTGGNDATSAGGG